MYIIKTVDRRSTRRIVREDAQFGRYAQASLGMEPVWDEDPEPYLLTAEQAVERLRDLVRAELGDAGYYEDAEGIQQTSCDETAMEWEAASASLDGSLVLMSIEPVVVQPTDFEEDGHPTRWQLREFIRGHRSAMYFLVPYLNPPEYV